MTEVNVMMEGIWKIWSSRFHDNTSKFGETAKSVLLGQLTITNDSYVFMKNEQHEILDHYKKVSFIQKESGRILLFPSKDTAKNPGWLGNIKFESDSGRVFDGAGYNIYLDEVHSEITLLPDFHVHPPSNDPPRIVKDQSK